MKKNKLIILTALTLLSLSACSKKQVEPTETSSLEAIEPEETETQAVDKLEDGGTLVVPTIGTKEIEVEVVETNASGEEETVVVKETVGIVETLAPEVEVSTASAEESAEAEALRPDVIVDSNNEVGIEAGRVEVSESLTEEQSVIMDSIIEFWQSEPRLGEDYLDYILENSDLASLSADSKSKIKTTIMKYYPHDASATISYEEIQAEMYGE